MKRLTSRRRKRRRRKQRSKAKARRARLPGGNGNGKEEDFRRVDGRCRRDEKASRGEADAAKLQGGSDAASGSGFQVYPRDSEEDAVFASGVCTKAADQRKNLGEMGAGAGQTESSGGSAGSAGTQLSGHARAAGKGGGGVNQCR